VIRAALSASELKDALAGGLTITPCTVAPEPR